MDPILNARWGLFDAHISNCGGYSQNEASIPYDGAQTMIESLASDITKKLECLDSTVGNKESSLSTPSNGVTDVEEKRLEVPATFEETGYLYNIYDRHTLYKEVWELPVSEVAKKYGISDVMILPGIGPSISKISFKTHPRASVKPQYNSLILFNSRFMDWNDCI